MELAVIQAECALIGSTLDENAERTFKRTRNGRHGDGGAVVLMLDAGKAFRYIQLGDIGIARRFSAVIGIAFKQQTDTAGVDVMSYIICPSVRMRMMPVAFFCIWEAMVARFSPVKAAQ